MAGNKRSGITISDAVTRFRTRLDGRNVNSRYARDQIRKIEMFAEWCSARRKYWLTQIDLPTVEEYLYPPQGGGMANLAPSSFNQSVGALSRFWTWCVGAGLAEYDPFRDVQRKHHHSPWVPLILSPTEMINLLEASATPRTRALMAVAMNTGLRSIDIYSLHIGDMDLASGQLSVYIHKTHKHDVKPMTAELIDEMRRWLGAYAKIAGNGMTAAELPNTWALFPSMAPGLGVYRFKDVTRTGMPRGTVVTNVLGKLGYPTAQEGFHTLRRSSARALFEDLQGTDGRDRALLIVRDFLNHESVVQTEKYLGLSHERKARNDHLLRQSFLSRMAKEASQQGDVVETGGVREIA